MSNLALSVMIYAPGVGPVYRSLPAIPNIALASIMASRVYRHTRFGLLRESGNMSLAGPIGETTSVNRSIPLRLVGHVEEENGEQEPGVADTPFDKKRGMIIAISKSSTIAHDFELPREHQSDTA